MTVARDLFKYSAAFRVGSIILVIMLVIAALSFFSPYAPDDRRVVPMLILISFILKGKMSFLALGLLLGLLDWAWPSKRYRAQILTLREEEFTQTAVFSGMGTLKVILREHFPFLIPFTLADAVTGFLWAIGMEITLSILGLSDLGTPSIGTMIYWANYYQAMLARKLWWLAAPIIASILIVIGFYLLSSSLSEYLDPCTRLKRLSTVGE